MRLLFGSLLAAITLGFIGLGCRPPSSEAESPATVIAREARAAVTQGKDDRKVVQGGKKTKGITAGAAGIDKAIQLQEWTESQKVPAYATDGKRVAAFDGELTVYAERKVISATRYFIVLGEVDITPEEAKDLIAFIDKVTAVKESEKKAPVAKTGLVAWWGHLYFSAEKDGWWSRVDDGPKRNNFIRYKPADLKKALRDALDTLEKLKKVKPVASW